MAKNRPYCWNVKWKKFDTTMDEYLENKVGYLMKDKNINLRNYEEIIYDFYPDRERIDTVFDKFQTVYDYKLHDMSKALKEKLAK